MNFQHNSVILYWKTMPLRTYTVKKEKAMLGFKASEDKLSMTGADTVISPTQLVTAN